MFAEHINVKIPKSINGYRYVEIFIKVSAFKNSRPDLQNDDLPTP